MVFGALLAPLLLGLAGLCRAFALGFVLLARLLSAVSSLLRSLVAVGTGLDTILFGAAFTFLLFFWPVVDLLRFVFHLAYFGEGLERVADALSDPCFLPSFELSLDFLGLDFSAQLPAGWALVWAALSVFLPGIGAGLRLWFVYTLSVWCRIYPSSVSCTCRDFS